MRLSEILKKKMSFSFEVFPPKEDKPLEPLLEVLDKLCRFHPDFISCTYGAGGTNKGRNSEICAAIAAKKVECVTHFTCIGNTKEAIADSLRSYTDIGIENILALRGDIPSGWEGTRGDFTHANELIRFIKRDFPIFGIAAACYPEKHPESVNTLADIAHLRAKQDAGAELFISQLCYDVCEYERFIEHMRKSGVHIPVIMGVLPVLNPNGLKRMTLSNGCSIPKELSELIGKYEDKPDDFKKAGKEYTVELLYRYINAGVDGIHIYALNKYDDVADILDKAGIW